MSTLPLTVRENILDNSDRLGKNFTIDLSGNELKSDCNNMEFLRWIYSHRTNMKHFQNYTYVGKLQFKSLNGTIINTLKSTCRSYTAIIVVCSIILSIFLSLIIVGVVYKNRWKIRYFLYMSKIGIFGYHRIVENPDRDNYRFDAFISYAEENLRFILDGIIPKLEVQEESLSLCIHQRDFVPGNPISDNIIEAIRKSRKTVIILSNSFLKKKWCMYEFNMARMESLYSREENHIVLVMLEHVTVKDMPLEMIEWIKDNSYLEYTTDDDGESLFWNNLIRAIEA